MDLAKTLALSAVGGLVVGFVGCSSDQKTTDTPAGDSSATPADSSKPDATKNCCKQKNDCKQKGGCKAEDGSHDCKGKNDCKQKGGCSNRDCGAT